MMTQTTVLLTGASGFIALHIIDELIRRGYRVIGTVRSQAKADKITKQFTVQYPNTELSFEIVEDIAAEGAFDDVLKNHQEITEVLHIVPPFSFGLEISFEEAYVYPATKGTKNILEAVKNFAPQVNHVVVTSSFAAIVNTEKISDKSFIHTEETWNPIEWSDVKDQFAAYTASKKCAEVIARKFVEEEKPNFTLTTVNPPYVFGPQKFDEVLVNPTLNTSAEVIHQLLAVSPDNTKFQAQPLALSSDVRDVAKLHVLPLENDNLAGLRLFPVNCGFNSQTLLNILHKLFPELDGKVGKGNPKGAEEVAKRDNYFYDTTETEKATGLTWTPLETAIKDFVSQILKYKKEHGQL
jgi:NADPH-dependent methylglyoxal reductase